MRNHSDQKCSIFLTEKSNLLFFVKYIFLFYKEFLNFYITIESNKPDFNLFYKFFCLFCLI